MLSVDPAFPKEIGGNGGATNPEQLFAAGFSACFGQSLSFVASQRKLPVDVKRVSGTTRVHLLRIEGGFGPAADLFIRVPGVDREVAEELVEATKPSAPTPIRRGGKFRRPTGLSKTEPDPQVSDAGRGSSSSSSVPYGSGGDRRRGP
ncbi:OsmC family protein [Larkinella soli]|uniref:OsmC family protein n=1 Tax=Larkinella soli TaxID=1770527 RepID=UPI0019D0F41E|nr:OsmC family protein [Larkinella soli]